MNKNIEYHDVFISAGVTLFSFPYIFS